MTIEIDGVYCNENGVPVDGWKIMDVVNCLGRIGTITKLRPNRADYLTVTYEDGDTGCFSEDGRMSKFHVFSSLRLLRRNHAPNSLYTVIDKCTLKIVAPLFADRSAAEKALSKYKDYHEDCKLVLLYLTDPDNPGQGILP